MDNILKKQKTEKRISSKYAIFSIFFLMAFFALTIFSNVNADAAASLTNVHGSNYTGNVNSKVAKKHVVTTGTAPNTTTVTRYFVQGTGIAKKDVVTFTISGLNKSYSRIAIAEGSQNMSTNTASDYDSYIKVNDVWTNDKSTSGNKPGLDMTSNDACTALGATDAASSLLLSANKNDVTNIALFCMDSSGGEDVLKYAYTIRNGGYGLKTIHIFLYNTDDATATAAEHLIVPVVISKPISTFDPSLATNAEDGFTWVNTDDGTCTQDHKIPTGAPATEDICVFYVNGSTGNTNTELTISIPKEVAYLHSIDNSYDNSNPDAYASKIPNNSIYAINTFKNDSQVANDVKYYYWKFNYETYTVGTAPDIMEVVGNQDMNEDYKYYLAISIDASGSYTFYIEDYFGNTFQSYYVDGKGTDVTITDVSKRNILIEYTNADLLTILEASVGLSGDNDLFGGGVVTLTYKDYDETAGVKYKVMYVNLQKDQTTIVVEVFTKILIDEGIYYCKDTNADCDSGVEDIRKSAINASEDLNGGSATTKYWRVDASNLDNKTIPATATTADNLAPDKYVSVSHGTYVQGNSYVNRGFNANGYNNRLEITVDLNGRYRFSITDKYGNTTDSVRNDTSSAYKNPSVDVSVIDKTTPVVYSAINATTINSYDYVKGGGNQAVSSSINLIEYPETQTIYYDKNGSKLFDYEDAIKIGQVNAKDESSFSSYFTNYVYGSGAYTDFSKGLYSDRNLGGTTDQIATGFDLHEFIINYNVTSFTGGLTLPNETASIADKKFTLNSVVYTIEYTNDRPVKIKQGATDKADITDGRSFTLNSKKYIISGNRIVSYMSESTDATSIKVPVVGTSYGIGDTDLDHFLYTTGGYGNGTNSVQFVNALNSPSYSNAYVGFMKIEFKDAETDATICTLSETATGSNSNAECFKEMNKRIDNVRDFTMSFTAYDYVGHVSNTVIVSVEIIDNTAPGYTTSFVAKGSGGVWTNKFNNSACMLEIGNNVQSKDTLLNCYGFGTGMAGATPNAGTYYFKDNDTKYDGTNDGQWYLETGMDTYFGSIKLEIEKDDGTTYDEVTNNSVIRLDKAKQHKLRVTIYDNWDNIKADGNKNYLEIYVEYYVNPRILMIEPIAASKTYGEDDKKVSTTAADKSTVQQFGFDFCVYINTDNSTFSQESNFFNLNFVNSYFKLAYCTNADDFTARSSKALTGITASNITTLANVLVNENKFTGTLSRVESEWYNEHIGYATTEGQPITDDAVTGYTKLTSTNKTQNNYVGQYNIVLGSLAIHASAGSSSALCTAGTDGYTCDQDYIIKIKPDLLVNNGQSGSNGEGGTPIVGNTQLNAVQTQNKDLKNDSNYTESTVKYTIKQAILSVVANGGSKTFGEQDLNSNNWNAQGTVINSSVATGYLNGYSVTGLKDSDGSDENNNTSAAHYDDTLALDKLINGVLRREVGEVVGRYMICNIKTATPSSVNSSCTMSYAASSPNDYAANGYNYAAYDLYGEGGTSSTAALVIGTNAEVYGTVAGKKLNTGNRNYVIDFSEEVYTINANELMVQPGINQGKEYSSSEYHDPIWQIVVYGETVTCSNVTTCTSNILVKPSDASATVDSTNFSGYTANIATFTYTQPTIDTYKATGKTADTNIYYSRRKTSPDITYTYQTTVALTTDSGKYTNVYKKSGDYYYLVATPTSTTLNTDYYVYAYGSYHAISSFSSGVVTINVTGHLVNQTYKLFVGQDNNEGTAVLNRKSGIAVDWYSYYQNTDKINNTTTYFKLKDNSRNDCTIAANSITVSADGEANCRNYNLKVEYSAPDKYTKADGTEITTEAMLANLAQAITIDGNNTVYKPDGLNACTSASAYTAACTSNTTEVLFEIFKREIVVSFDANKYIFVYGQRYDYYDGGSVTINGKTDGTAEENREYNYVTDGGYYNSKNGIFKVYDSTSEGDIFVCYNEYHVAVTCTNTATVAGNVYNPSDYGVTAGDTWTSIGLEFFMHSILSDNDSDFYDSASDYAIPAGTYYVYANISDAAKANYKFTYLGGTITIIPKVTSVQLTSYTKEYKEAGFYSYGLGSDYSSYTDYASNNRCMYDSYYFTESDDLISDVDCLSTDNEVGNTYGFTIEGLDSKDTIADNFNGRPSRTGTVNDNVGFYKIGVGTIVAKPKTLVDYTKATTSNACATSPASYLSSDGKSLSTDCIFNTNYITTGQKSNNYNITYSITNNEGAYLFITPAKIDITVDPNQTKMYGCSYDAYNTSSDYGYTVENGYTHDVLNCNGSKTSPTDDISYRYNVSGDKDYGSNYVVTGDMPQAGLTNSVLEGSLYRVKYVTGAVDYSNIKSDSANNIFQDQQVGTYIITLGDLNVKENSSDEEMCDAFNNPSLTGTVKCRNYNLNYYGNSTSDDNSNNDDSNDQQKHTGTGKILLTDLQTYDLNYVTATNGKYVLMNGKYVKLTEIATYTNYYVAISSLEKYKINSDYVIDLANGTLVYINNSTVVLSGGSPATKNGYVQLTDLQRFDSTGANASNGDYIKVNNKLIALSVINKYKASATKYTSDNAGEYVLINGEYVNLNSLNKYKETSGVFSLDNTNGTHVLIYGETSTNGLTKYNLNKEDMYKVVADGSGAYVFINGAYVLKNGLTLDGDGKVTINSGKKSDGSPFYGTTDNDGNGVNSKVQFTITLRDVHLHPEYNVKYIGNPDVEEKITCTQIDTAYGLTDFTGRTSYCDGSTRTEVNLGVARYYAVDNSLAKYPWTVWVDKANSSNGISAVETGKVANDYNDIQFDVINGKLKRAGSGTNDQVGKYTYDFADIKVVSALSGNNYIIKIETSVAWSDTYVHDEDGYALLSSKTRYADSGAGTEDNNNGYYIKIKEGGVEVVKSISLVDKYSESDGTYYSIDYWYVGFYAEDSSDGRSGELAKWWTDNSIFENHYDKLREGKDNADQPLDPRHYIGIVEPYLVNAREVYFEIVRRTIYLYAIDTTKVYGNADKYSDFKVAICYTANGYIVDGEGNVKCRDTGNNDTHGLSDEHLAFYVNTDHTMKQNTIRGITASDDYLFIGSAANSFRIYFKRNVGEDVGVYSVTACAAQTGISDCSDPSSVEAVGAATYIGDNYNIIEIAGTLTITTRKITIVPDGTTTEGDSTNQGFMYGNYTNDGSIPSITYKEYYEYVNGSNMGSQGMVNSGNSATSSDTATCLINVSGDSIVCINDNQNNNNNDVVIDVNNNVYLHQDRYTSNSNKISNVLAGTTSTIQGLIDSITKVYHTNDVYKDSYSDPDNLASRDEADTRYALNRICGTTIDLRYSRDVCNYEIVAGELAEGTTWEEKNISQYVRIVPSNRFTRSGEEGSYTYTQADEGTYLKVGTRYYEITNAKRHTYTYVENNNGLYLKATVDGVVGYYKIIDANRYNFIAAETRYVRSNTGTHLKTGDDYTEITAAIRYNLSNQTMAQKDDGEFLLVEDTDYNYTIEKFITGIRYEIKEATLTLTPLADQYKIYGEVDPEIKFEVYTTYTVKSDHLIPHNNVTKIMRGGDDVTSTVTATTYNASYETGTDYIKVLAGDIITLQGYAYKENIGDYAGALNYGKNFGTSVSVTVGASSVSVLKGLKHDTSEKTLTQSSTDSASKTATHYDKYNEYKASVTTSRILLGNFYVEDHNQNVGVRNISNGFIVNKNNLGNRNYLLPAANVNASNVTFSIIPRPIFVEIQAITKEYGQATDILSCDSGVATCELQTYNSTSILSNGKQYLIYNYIVKDRSTLPNDLTKTIGTVTNIYNTGTINLPNETTQSFASTLYDGLVQVDQASKYYTNTGSEEMQGGNITSPSLSSTDNDLQIIVERGNYNTSITGGACYVSGEGYVKFTGKGCEDVGVYYTRFRGIYVNTGVLPTDPATVSEYYFSDYWGYNPNYYVRIENTTDTSTDASLNVTDSKDTRVMGSTLTIVKKPIEIVIETFDDGDAATDDQIRSYPVITDKNSLSGLQVGEAYSIEENMDVPALPTISNTNTHTTYRSITWAQHPAQVRTSDKIYGTVAYCQTAVAKGSFATIEEAVQKYSECADGALIYHESKSNNANSGPVRFDTSEAGYYAITRHADVLYISNDNSSTSGGTYEANNYTTTFVNGILVVDEDKTAPVIFAGSEYYSIEANNGNILGINDFTEDTTSTGNFNFLNALALANKCKDVSGITDVSIGDCDSKYFTTAIPINSNQFDLNGYKYKIEDGKVKGVTRALEVDISTDKFTIDSKEYTIIKDASSNNLFIVREEDTTNAIDQVTLTTLLQWFNIRSHDPSVVRAGENVGKRYDPSYYIAIDSHFNQRVVGSYTLYIYALDNAGNFSRATTVTLHVKDTTAPEVGYLNLYSGTISCNFATNDCVSNEGSWIKDNHTVWTNDANGVWLSITGGGDNTLAYLNIAGRDLYTLSADSFTKVASGTGLRMLNGSIVKLSNMTQYYIQDNDYDDDYIVIDPNKTYADDERYVRIGGEYKAVSSLNRYSLSGNTYTKDADGDLIVIGSFVEIPDQRYTVATNVITQNSSGTYIKLEQWAHFFSRDNGATWIKYDREDVDGYLALGSDGQRLIMIKAADYGVTYKTNDAATNTVEVDGTAGHHYSHTYYNKKEEKWEVSKETSLTFLEHKTATLVNNIGAWATMDGDDTNDTTEYYRDRIYAYLDTQLPLLTLDQNNLGVFEYGCENCTVGYGEEYGYTSDNYLLPLSLFNRYSDAAATVKEASGNYIRKDIKVNGKNSEEIVELTGRVYKETETTQASCVGKWINGKCYVEDSLGTYVYLGTSVEVTPTIDTAMTAKIVDAIKGVSEIAVRVNKGNVANDAAGQNVVVIESKNINVATSVSATEKILTTTIYNVSGVSGQNIMTGAQSVDKNLELVDHEHKKVVIYLTVANPNASTTGNTLTNTHMGVNMFGSQINTNTTYYRYEISCQATGVDGDKNIVEGTGKCSISGKYSSSDPTVAAGADLGLTLTADSFTAAINLIVTNSLENKNYQGKDLTYSINYTTTDMAGNISKTQVRGIIFSNFLEAVTVQLTNEAGAATASLYNAYAIDVDQNSNPVMALGNFKVTTSKSEDNPLLDRYLIQTIYYNDTLIADKQQYDPATLEQLDTTVPGVYRVIYSTRRLDGDKFVYGTPFELTINVKPNVANVSAKNVDYKQSIIIAFAVSGIIALFAYMYIANKKRKSN